MPLTSLLKSAAGTCPFCYQKAGILNRSHPDCRRTYQAGWNEMVELAAHAAKSHEFNPNSRFRLLVGDGPSDGNCKKSKVVEGVKPCGRMDSL